MNEQRGNQHSRILYIDPSLRCFRGHHANVCGSIVGALRKLGHHVSVAIHRTADSGLEGDRVARFDVYRQMPLNPSKAKDRRKLSGRAARFCGDILSTLSTYRPHVIYMHSVGSIACEGMLRAMATLYLPDRAPKLIAELPFPSESKEGYYYREQLADMFQRLQKHEPDLLRPFFPVTVNTETSRKLSQAVDYEISTMPSPYITPRPPQLASRNLDKPICIGSVGHQSETKGFHLLPEIFQALQNSTRPVQFVVQIQPESDAETVRRLRAMQAAGVAIKFVEGDLSGAQYQSMLLDIDVILLSYQPERYLSAISGIGYEALSLGTVVVAPLHSTLGSLLRQYQPHSSLFETWTHAGIAYALQTCVANFDKLQIEARMGMDLYNKQNGPLIYAKNIVAQASSETQMNQLGRMPWIAKAFWETRGALARLSAA